MAANNTKLTAAEFFRKYSDIVTEAEQIKEFAPSEKEEKCPRCDGTGKEKHLYKSFKSGERETCDKCKGTGKVSE